jgi:manganese transport protein
MSGIVDLTLGIVSSMGGFIDIGELIFLAQAGSKFIYSLLWVVVLGTIGIIVYGEMSGRVAAVARFAVFDSVREKFPRPIGLIALGFSLLVTVVTCAAEIGGLALIAQLAFDWPYALGAPAAVLLLLAIIFFSPFAVVENVFGILGLTMLVFLAAAFFSSADWGAVLKGAVPSFPSDESPARMLLYAYFVVGIFSSVMMPYEVFFYSSGTIEEKWSVKDLGTNRLVCGLGFSFGSIVAIAILINSATLLQSRGIDPQSLGATALQTVIPFGLWGMTLGLLGITFALSGAAAETCLSGAYIVCQFFKLPWGKNKTVKQAPLFYAAWAMVLLLALIIALVGPEPLQTAEYAVIFSALALPLTYLAIFLAANDSGLMRKHVNGKLANSLALIFLVLVVLAAAAAIPLMIVTSAGEIS